MTTTAATGLIVRAERPDLHRLAFALAQAFQDDPVATWVIPDPGRRRALLPAVFSEFAVAYLRLHECYLADGGAGAALWAPAGTQPIPEEQQEGFGERLAGILGPDSARLFELDARLEQCHPQQPCWYLYLLGVVPARQGGGLGSALLTSVLARCDARGTPAYLEATSRDNRRLYERHGFRTTGEITLPGGPPLWSMWRDPAPVGPA